MADKNIGNALLFYGRRNIPANDPTPQYGSKQFPYYGNPSRIFTEDYAQYAANYFEAQVQGLNPDDPMEWQTQYIRMADSVSLNSRAEKMNDDWKKVLIANRGITYIPPGAKFVCMGNTWLATNPQNMTGETATAMVRRCNAVWNFLDYYGNVISEPIVVDSMRARATALYPEDTMLVNKGYFNVTCQYNEYTRQLDTNSRIVLGSQAYYVRGYSDFVQEFTGDYNSVRLLQFTIEADTVKNNMDDMENHVAGGKTFSWEILISGQAEMAAGSTAQFSATNIRKGVEVESTAENPITITWTSSDESVAQANGNGLISAISGGECVITAHLTQNPKYSASFAVNVASAGESYVAFSGNTPGQLSKYEQATVTAVYVENGSETALPVTWSLSGADAEAYSMEISGNSVTVTCWGGSVVPLTVTAMRGEYSASTEISLFGL